LLRILLIEHKYTNTQIYIQCFLTVYLLHTHPLALRKWTGRYISQNHIDIQRLSAGFGGKCRQRMLPTNQLVNIRPLPSKGALVDRYHMVLVERADISPCTVRDQRYGEYVRFGQGVNIRVSLKPFGGPNTRGNVGKLEGHGVVLKATAF